MSSAKKVTNKAKNKISRQRILGNVLIASSLFGFLLLFLPFLLTFLPKPEERIPDGLFLTIPKIHAQAPIVAGVDPWNRKEYSEALTFGIAHAKGTSLPGRKGHSFLFAHSSGQPWEIIRTNTPFLRLNEVSRGDTIYIYDNHKEYRYLVTEKKIVSPTDTTYLTAKKDNTLTLQTCWPPGTDWQRLLVLAHLEQ